MTRGLDFISMEFRPSSPAGRELYAAGVVRLIPLWTHLMVADTLTKSLPSPVLNQGQEDSAPLDREVMLGHTPFYARLLH
jgi:hypothetical protein